MMLPTLLDPTAFDHAVLTWVHAWRSPWADLAMSFVTWLGSLYVLLPVAVLLAAWRARGLPSGQRGSACFVPVALLGASVIVHTLKLAVARTRPGLFDPLITMPVDPSFPSAHTMQACAFAMACLLQRRHPGQVAGWVAAATFVVLVAASRVYLQVHFPSDVLAGAVLAFGWVVVLYRVWPGRAAAP